MSEKEIIENVNKLNGIYNELKKDDKEGHSSAYEIQFEDFEAIQGLLDLYQQEKEKNLYKDIIIKKFGKDKIREKIKELDKAYEDSKDKDGVSPYYYPDYIIDILKKLLEDK